MGGVKYEEFWSYDVKVINFEPELGEIHFILKDGRVARKHFRREAMQIILEMLEELKLNNTPKNRDKLLDTIDILEAGRYPET